MTGLKSIFAFLLIGLLSPVILGDSSYSSIGSYESDIALNRVVRSPDNSNPNEVVLQKKFIGLIISGIAALITGLALQSGSNAKNPLAPFFPIKAIPGTHPAYKPNEIVLTKTTAGLALIKLSNNKPLCTGVVLKPWIVLTTGECIKGQDVTKLSVHLTVKDAGKLFRIPVQAFNVTMHPKFKPGSMLNNFALLNIFSGMAWDVDPYYLPRFNFSTADIISKKVTTFADEWKPLEGENKNSPSVKVSKPVTDDFTLCGEGHPGSFFCALVKDGRKKYSSADIGTPLYYNAGPLRRLLGLYTGYKKDQDVKANVFQPIFPALDWIEDFLERQPLPPVGLVKSK